MLWIRGILRQILLQFWAVLCLKNYITCIIGPHHSSFSLCSERVLFFIWCHKIWHATVWWWNLGAISLLLKRWDAWNILKSSGLAAQELGIGLRIHRRVSLAELCELLHLKARGCVATLRDHCLYWRVLLCWHEVQVGSKTLLIS